MREMIKNEDVLPYFMPLGNMKMKLKRKNIENEEKEPWNNTTIQDHYNWNKIYKDRGYHATLDEISNVFYKELMAYYPKYKVIHSVRDAEKWYDSAFAATMCLHLMFKESWFWSFIIGKKRCRVYWDCMGDAIFDGKLRDKQYVMKRYNEWNEEVINYVPKDRLLLFDVKQGWEPLCKFLEIDEIPDIPFPHSNERELITNILAKMKIVKNIIDASLIIAIFGILYYYRDSKFMVTAKAVAQDKFVNIKRSLH